MNHFRTEEEGRKALAQAVEAHEIYLSFLRKGALPDIQRQERLMSRIETYRHHLSIEFLNVY